MSRWRRSTLAYPRADHLVHGRRREWPSNLTVAELLHLDSDLIDTVPCSFGLNGRILLVKTVCCCPSQMASSPSDRARLISESLRSGQMYLKMHSGEDDSLVEVLNLQQLFDPFAAQVLGRLHAGEELQEPSAVEKAQLVFPSGEPLPRCWTNPRYGAQA